MFLGSRLSLSKHISLCRRIPLSTRLGIAILLSLNRSIPLSTRLGIAILLSLKRSIALGSRLLLAIHMSLRMTMDTILRLAIHMGLILKISINMDKLSFRIWISNSIMMICAIFFGMCLVFFMTRISKIISMIFDVFKKLIELHHYTTTHTNKTAQKH